MDDVLDFARGRHAHVDEEIEVAGNDVERVGAPVGDVGDVEDDRVEGVVETQASPAYRQFAWPLEVGREWEASYRWENPAERRTDDRVRRLKVEALEAIKVPAGVFQAFHATARDRGGRLTYESWYSPEVKWIIKDRTYFSYGVRERELLEYKLKSTVAPIPSSGSGR